MPKQQTSEKIFEPDEGITHYAPPFGLDQVTLCGVTDWLGGRTPGVATDKPVNCHSCLQIVKHVKATKFD
jgi:hypothetical protein